MTATTAPGATESHELEALEGAAIGIDLGTTNSAVGARLPDGRFVVIPPEGQPQGRTTMPSLVAFNDKGQHLIGFDARRIKADGVKQKVLSSVKRLLGRTYQEAHDVGLTPNALGADPRGRQHDLVRFRVPSGHKLSVEEVTALLLRGLRQRAERFLNKKVTRAVIGVPARFSSMQRSALEYATKLSGLNHVKLIAEPELAVRAYGLSFNPESCKSDGEEPPPLAMDENGNPLPPMERHILVADLGGGTFDVTVVKQLVEVDELHIIYTSGDERLGGDDFDDALFRWAKKELQMDLKRINQWPLTVEMTRKLRLAVRRAKERLSSADKSEVEFCGQKLELTRNEFNMICIKPLRRMLLPIRLAAHAAGLKLPNEIMAERVYGKATKEKRFRDRKPNPKGDDHAAKVAKLKQMLMAPDPGVSGEHEVPIDEVMCVGAASWTPAVRDLLELITGVKPTVATVDPESAVVVGATVMAAVVDSSISDMQVHSGVRLAWAKYLVANVEKLNLNEPSDAVMPEEAASRTRDASMAR